MRRSAVFLSLMMQAITTKAQPDYSPAAPPATDIIRMEYFVDVDPGFGNGIPVAITAAQNISNFSFNANIAGLSNGFHRFYLRSMDANGRWSHANHAFFDNYIVPVYPAADGLVNIVAAEYFIDTDPGTGNATAITITPAVNISNLSVAVNVSSLQQGSHRLYIRTKDASGKWSLTNIAIFDNAVSPDYPTAAPLSNIAALEYFIDTDPGFGNGTPVSINQSANIANLNVNVAVGALTMGKHTVYIRSRQNPWSFNAYADFMVTAALPVTWKYVKAEATTDGSLVSWSTGSEQNAKLFIVECSINGTSFSPVGQVQSNGNAAGSSYSFKHTGIAGGVVYYRIKQVDNDGSSNYSKTIVLLFQNKLQSPAVFPNPANSVVNIAVPVQQQIKSLRIYDSGGRLVKNVQVNSAQTVITLPVNELSKGQYHMVVETTNGTTALPFIKQ